MKPGGVFALSTHHPGMDLELSPSGDYFATDLVVDRWSVGESEYDVHFWRRPLSETFQAIADGGFRSSCSCASCPPDGRTSTAP